MMLQGYVLTIAYLAFGAGLLLVDYYGGRLLLLVRARHSLRNNRSTQIFLLIGGMFTVIIKLFFPVPPGPILIGDFFPSIIALVLTIYYLYQMVTAKRNHEQPEPQGNGGFEQEVLAKTGKLIETNKRNLGFVVLAFAVLHFLIPQFVLL